MTYQRVLMGTRLAHWQTSGCAAPEKHLWSALGSLSIKFALELALDDHLFRWKKFLERGLDPQVACLPSSGSDCMLLDGKQPSAQQRLAPQKQAPP